MTNVNTLADLRAYTVTGLTDEFVINLLGHTTIGDEGFGQWKVIPTSVAQRADDNGTFVHLAASNWYGQRLYNGRATLEMFGAKRNAKYLRDWVLA